MKKRIIIGVFFTVTFLSLTMFNSQVNAAVYNEIAGTRVAPESDIELSITAPGIINDTVDFLNRLEYDNSITEDKRINWKITEYEKTDNFHIAEGDKKLKAGDRIIVTIGAEPRLQLPEVHTWCLVYVNDVMARYHSAEDHRFGVFKYIQPIEINVSGYSDVHDIYDDEIDGLMGFFDYMEHSTAVDHSMWSFEEDVAIYNYTQITEYNNISEIQLTFDKKSGFLNEMEYSVSYINGSGYPAGVNLSMIRLHGWGLQYNVTTWLVWTPIIIVSVALIVAIRMRLFQRYKLHREAKKLAKRE